MLSRPPAARPSCPEARSNTVDGSEIGANATRMSSNKPKPPLEAKAEARDALLDNAHLIQAFAEENPLGLDETTLQDVRGWQHFLRDTFFVERDLRKHTVFLREGTEPRAYGVLGLTELTNLMGCYAMLAFNVNTFGVELPADRTEDALPI